MSSCDYFLYLSESSIARSSLCGKTLQSTFALARRRYYSLQIRSGSGESIRNGVKHRQCGRKSYLPDSIIQISDSVLILQSCSAMDENLRAGMTSDALISATLPSPFSSDWTPTGFWGNCPDGLASVNVSPASFIDLSKSFERSLQFLSTTLILLLKTSVRSIPNAN